MAATKSFAVSVLAIVALLGAVHFSPATALPGKNEWDAEVQKCLDGINQDCKVIITAWMMLGDALPPSEGCCARVIDMGKECHDKIVARFIENKRYKGEPEDVVRRSIELWEFCAFEMYADDYDYAVVSPAPAPGAQ